MAETDGLSELEIQKFNELKAIINTASYGELEKNLYGEMCQYSVLFAEKIFDIVLQKELLGLSLNLMEKNLVKISVEKISYVLEKAAYFGNFGLVQYIMENYREQINSQSISKALRKASALGNLREVKALVNDKRMDNDNSALKAAIASKNFDIAKVLLSKGFSLTKEEEQTLAASCFEKFSYQMYCFCGGVHKDNLNNDIESLRQLLEFGFNTNEQSTLFIRKMFFNISGSLNCNRELLFTYYTQIFSFLMIYNNIDSYVAPEYNIRKMYMTFEDYNKICNIFKISKSTHMNDYILRLCRVLGKELNQRNLGQLSKKLQISESNFQYIHDPERLLQVIKTIRSGITGNYQYSSIKQVPPENLENIVQKVCELATLGDIEMLKKNVFEAILKVVENSAPETMQKQIERYKMRVEIISGELNKMVNEIIMNDYNSHIPLEIKYNQVLEDIKHGEHKWSEFIREHPYVYNNDFSKQGRTEGFVEVLLRLILMFLLIAVPGLHDHNNRRKPSRAMHLDEELRRRIYYSGPESYKRKVRSDMDMCIKI